MTAVLTMDDVALLRTAVLAHVATTMADGSPQVTPVWIDTDGEALLFNTAKGRVKHRSLARDPRVAVSVVDRADDRRTCVVRGTAELIDAGADAHLDALREKYLGPGGHRDRWPDAGERVIVRVVPTSIVRTA